MLLGTAYVLHSLYATMGENPLLTCKPAPRRLYIVALPVLILSEIFARFCSFLLIPRCLVSLVILMSSSSNCSVVMFEPFALYKTASDLVGLILTRSLLVYGALLCLIFLVRLQYYLPGQQCHRHMWVQGLVYHQYMFQVHFLKCYPV